MEDESSCLWSFVRVGTTRVIDADRVSWGQRDGELSAVLGPCVQGVHGSRGDRGDQRIPVVGHGIFVPGRIRLAQLTHPFAVELPGIAGSTLFESFGEQPIGLFGDISGHTVSISTYVFHVNVSLSLAFAHELPDLSSAGSPSAYAEHDT